MPEQWYGSKRRKSLSKKLFRSTIMLTSKILTESVHKKHYEFSVCEWLQQICLKSTFISHENAYDSVMKNQPCCFFLEGKGDKATALCCPWTYAMILETNVWHYYYGFSAAKLSIVQHSTANEKTISPKSKSEVLWCVTLRSSTIYIFSVNF